MSTTIRLSAQIMAHPKRADQVSELRSRLDGPVDVTWDTDNTVHDTGPRAMAAHHPAATHHLVIQDDAVVCRDLLAGVERMLAYVPALTPVSLYVGRARPFPRSVEAAVAAAGDSSASFLTMPQLNWGVAVVMPVPLIRPLLEWYPASRAKGYDARIGHWLLLNGVRCWYTWPSLVDHRDGESLIGHGQRRVAHTFVGATMSALELDWSGAVLRVNTFREVPTADDRAHARRRRRRQP